MYSGKNRVQHAVRMIIDSLNVILGVAAIVLAVMVFINTEDNKWMFPIIFSIGGGMNLITGIKYFITDFKVRGIICEIAAVVLFAITYISFRAIGAR